MFVFEFGLMLEAPVFKFGRGLGFGFVVMFGGGIGLRLDMVAGSGVALI